MAEPTLALTYQDFIIRIAEYLGVASYANTVAAIPTDAHDLEVCKRLANDGYRRFYNSNPQWNWTLQDFSITFDTAGTTDKVIDSTAWRYYMPDGFYGHLVGRMTYAENSSSIDLVQTRIDIIRARYARASQSGYPTEFALAPLGGDNRRRWEIAFWPEPGSADTVTGRCRVYPNRLIELPDTPNCGFQFDEALVAACLAEAERQKEDAQTVMESQWAEALVRAIAIDQKTAPARLGDYGGGERRHERIYSGVDGYYSGGLTGTYYPSE